MAEIPHRQPASGAHASNTLTYGHFGTATYDAASRCWHFLRKPSLAAEKLAHDDGDLPRSPFRVLKPFTKILASPSPARLAGTEYQNSELYELPSPISKPKLLPELRAANDIVSRGLRSDHLIDHDEENSGTPSTLVFGTATVLDNERGRSHFATVPVAAIVTGRASDQISFKRLRREQIKFDDEAGSETHMHISSMEATEHDLWSSTGTISLLTVSGEGSSDSDTWFAAITHQGLSLFRPTIRKYGIKTPLSANHILSIPLSRTGQLLHAHAAFHPQLSNNIAIVDIEGNWSIWVVKSKNTASARNLQQARLLVSGSLPTSFTSLNGTTTSSKHYVVGWHRVCWLASTAENIDRLLLCNRHCAFLLDLSGRILQMTDFGLKGGIPRALLLDVQPSRYSTAGLWVLTTSNLLWMSIDSSQDQNVDNSDGLHLVLSWNHFRGRSDRSLSMHLLESERTVWIVLSSKITSYLTAYHHSAVDTRRPIISDPYFLRIPCNSSDPAKVLLFHSVEAKGVSNATQASPLWLFKAFLYHPADVLEEGLFSIREGFLREDEGTGSRHEIKLPSESTTHNQSTRFVDDASLYDFITSDNDFSSSEDNQTNHKGATYSVGQSQTAQIDPSSSTHNLELIYQDVLGSALFSNSLPPTRLQDYLTATRKVMGYNGGGLEPAKLFSELPFNRPYISEIEHDSENILSFMDDIRSEVDRSSLGPIFSIERLSYTTLLEIYDTIVDDWLLPLSPDVPDRTRVCRERLARQIALDIFLSNQIILKGSLESRDDVDGEDRWRAVHSPTKVNSEVNPIFSDETPHPSNDDTQQADRHRAEKRTILDMYTSFTKPKPAVEPTEAVENILFHLPQSIDADPLTYDYSATEIQFAATQLEREHQQLDPRAKRRAERLARSRQKRLEKQDAVKKVTFESRSAVPMITSSQLPIRNVQSSQLAPFHSSQTEQDGRGGPVSMSQPERGVFGARVGTKSKQKKKSGRNAGF